MKPEAGIGLFFIDCNKGIAGFRATFWKRYGIKYGCMMVLLQD